MPEDAPLSSGPIVDNPGSPQEWLAFLLPKLDHQAESARLYRRYYAGEHRIAYATASFRQIFDRFFPGAATPDNWMRIVTDSVVERLRINGFRFGDDSKQADEDVRKVWQANRLDGRSRQIHTEAVRCGKAFILVDPVRRTKQGTAVVTGETPLEVYVHTDPATGERLAAVKRWWGDDKYAYAILYLPDRIYRFRSRGRVRAIGGRKNWEPQGALPNPKNVVPMIPLENNPDLVEGGISDLDVVIPIQDRVNKLCLDLDVGSEFYAAPQRWATGWEPPTDDEGKPLPHTKVEAAVSRFLAFSDPEAKVGQLPPGDPGTYVQPIEMYVQHIAALTRTPPHYLLGKMANLAGEALKAAETGLVARAEGKHDDFSDPWEEAMGLATGKDPTDAITLWRDPESRTFGQLVDGVIKLRKELALPLEMAWEQVGLSPEEIERAKKLINLPEREFRDLDRTNAGGGGGTPPPGPGGPGESGEGDSGMNGVPPSSPPPPVVSE